MEITSGLDLNESWAPDYATEKIPLQLQRLYLTYGLGIASLLRHTARLRSWRETKRTAGFCAVSYHGLIGLGCAYGFLGLCYRLAPRPSRSAHPRLADCPRELQKGSRHPLSPGAPRTRRHQQRDAERAASKTARHIQHAYWCTRETRGRGSRARSCEFRGQLPTSHYEIDRYAWEQ